MNTEATPTTEAAVDTGPIAGTVVVGVDGSEGSDRALEWAVAQAAAQRAGVTLVHAAAPVVPTYGYRTMGAHGPDTDQLEEQGRAVLRSAHERVTALDPGLAVHELFRVDDPRQLLLDLSRVAALVVVGSRGLGRVRSLLLGSVGVALTRHAHCPVVVHRPGRTDQERRGVAVAVDATADAFPVLEFAFGQAVLLGTPLTVLHCAWDVMAVHTVGHDALARTEPDLEEGRRFLDEAVHTMAEKYPTVPASVRVAWGAPADEMSRLEDMELLVVGAHQRGRWHQTLIGSVSVSMVEHAHSPVAVVPVVSPS
jgi:nucleotide-binding universal stress UspA family protein